MSVYCFTRLTHPKSSVQFPLILCLVFAKAIAFQFTCGFLFWTIQWLFVSHARGYCHPEKDLPWSGMFHYRIKMITLYVDLQWPFPLKGASEANPCGSGFQTFHLASICTFITNHIELHDTNTGWSQEDMCTSNLGSKCTYTHQGHKCHGNFFELLWFKGGIIVHKVFKKNKNCMQKFEIILDFL